MNEKTYFIMEVVGTSKDSIDAAIKNAISAAAEKGCQVRWFEVVETRGFVAENKIEYFQVKLKVGHH